MKLLLLLQFVQLHCESCIGKLTKIEYLGEKNKYIYSYINKAKESKELILTLKPEDWSNPIDTIIKFDNCEEIKIKE